MKLVEVFSKGIIKRLRNKSNFLKEKHLIAGSLKIVAHFRKAMGPGKTINKLQGKMALLSPQAINSTAIKKQQINFTQTYLHIYKLNEKQWVEL